MFAFSAVIRSARPAAIAATMPSVPASWAVTAATFFTR
jgi:hypothetical protein